MSISKENTQLFWIFLWFFGGDGGGGEGCVCVMLGLSNAEYNNYT